MQPAGSPFVDELVRQLRYQSHIHIAPAIPARKLENALMKNGYTGQDPIVGLLDCTVFGSAKDHLMFTSTGLYFNHMGATPPAGQILYSDFHRCHFAKSGGFLSTSIDTGVGIIISTTGSNMSRNNVIELLTSIKSLAVSQLSVQPSMGQGTAPVPVNQSPQEVQSQIQPATGKAELLAHAHNMEQAKNWVAAIEAYEQAGEYRMAGLMREQQILWKNDFNN